MYKIEKLENSNDNNLHNSGGNSTRKHRSFPYSNTVNSNLSNILKHVNELLNLSDILEMIHEYNLTHIDNKFPDEYIDQLIEYNIQVNKVIEAIIKYSSANMSERYNIMKFIKERSQFLTERLNTLSEEINEEVNSENKSDIVKILEEKELNFTWHSVGEIEQLRSSSEDEGIFCVTFANITVNNIIIDIKIII